MSEIDDTVQTPEQIPEQSETSYAEALEAIKNEYAEKITSIKTESAKAIKERDEIIKQLLTEENVSRETFVDKINSKRNYKKW